MSALVEVFDERETDSQTLHHVPRKTKCDNIQSKSRSLVSLCLSSSSPTPLKVNSIVSEEEGWERIECWILKHFYRDLIEAHFGGLVHPAKLPAVTSQMIVTWQNRAFFYNSLFFLSVSTLISTITSTSKHVLVFPHGGFFLVSGCPGVRALQSENWAGRKQNVSISIVLFSFVSVIFICLIHLRLVQSRIKYLYYLIHYLFIFLLLIIGLSPFAWQNKMFMLTVTRLARKKLINVFLLSKPPMQYFPSFYIQVTNWKEDLRTKCNFIMMHTEIRVTLISKYEFWIIMLNSKKSKFTKIETGDIDDKQYNKIYSPLFLL